MTFGLITPNVLNSTTHAVKDFKNIGDLAKRWGETVFHDWAWNKLNSSESVAIYKYTYKDHTRINKYLRATKGQLLKNTLHLGENYNCDYLNEKIKLIESGLKKVKVPETIMVYRRVDESFFGLDKVALRDKTMKIKIDIMKTIKQNYLNKQFINYGFLSTSLVNEPRHISFHYYDYPILMAIKVPKYTHGAYLGNSVAYYHNECEMLINRNYSLKYQNFKIINEFNSETLKINMSLE